VTIDCSSSTSTADRKDAQVPVEQYVYLGVKSTSLDPDQITERLGIEPDTTKWMGSRDPENVIPRCHLWHVECRDPGLDPEPCHPDPSASAGCARPLPRPSAHERWPG
jgi:hypothetical protein